MNINGFVFKFQSNEVILYVDKLASLMENRISIDKSIAPVLSAIRMKFNRANNTFIKIRE